jgi:competence protein ComEA
MRAPAPLATTPTTAAAPASSCAVNINVADASGLQNLPGIGETKAAAIIQYRTDHGNFASCDALDDVSGIGPATIASLKDCCTV